MRRRGARSAPEPARRGADVTAAERRGHHGHEGGAEGLQVYMVQKIVSQMQEGTEKPRHKIEFMVGELVRVKEGPFTDFNGSVEEVNYEKNRVRVSVMIFGRSTPVELEFAQVEKT